MVAWLTLCLCLCSLTTHFIADGLSRLGFVREACVCVSPPESGEGAETCDPDSSFVLPRPAHTGHQSGLRLTLAAPAWRALSQTISPRLPPPKTRIA
jgi:hypothetical protein